MLVLSRREGEKLLVGDAVITLIAVQGSRVRIGIEAPPEVHVLREELQGQQRDSLQPFAGQEIAPPPR